MVIGIFPNTEKEKLYTFIPKLLSFLEENEKTYLIPDYAKDVLEEHGVGIKEERYADIKKMGMACDCILSVGGDGSFLEAARQFADCPVLLAGVHLGDLGFLNAIVPAETEQRLRQIFLRDYELESRMFLKAYIERQDGSRLPLSPCLNDIVTGRERIGGMARLRLWINDRFVQEYAADGLIVSTPTGSTGYALSCGGSVLRPSAEKMLVVPICPHMAYGFSVVLDKEDVIKITLPRRERKLHISVDGSKTYEMTNADALYVTGERKKIRFIRFRDQDFFGELHTKFVRKICR